ISGSYPALFLSSFQVTRVLKGSMKFSRHTIFFRKGLVVFQFVLSIILIISTIIVANQIRYIYKKNLGFDRDNLAYIGLDGDLISKYGIFKQRVSGVQGVENISRMSADPTNIDAETF